MYYGPPYRLADLLSTKKEPTSLPTSWTVVTLSSIRVSVAHAATNRIKYVIRLETPGEGSQGTLARRMANELVKVGNLVTPVAARVLTPAQYGDLADVPPELEWLANITNPKTREA
jgi:hypothetical protein